MLKKCLLCLVLLSGLGLPLQACAEINGLGIILGNTTGFSFKHFVDRHLAFDLAVGAPFGYYVYSGVAMHGDVMWTDEMVKVRKGALLFHFGGGTGLALGSGNRDFEMGLRFTTGAEYFFHNSKFAVFSELAPTLIFIPALEGRMQGAVGGRYYF